MITPRQTRLHRVIDLQSFQRVIVDLACSGTVADLRSAAVLVPSRAAAAQLRRTIEHRSLLDENKTGPAALVLPDLVTREEWYNRLHERLSSRLPRLAPLEREVVLQVACREVIDMGLVPPFDIRPALLVEILSLYDELRRRRQTLADFERLLVMELEIDAENDAGARRMLELTRFLTSALRVYEERVRESGSVDEHQLRDRLLESTVVRPYRHVVVTSADQVMSMNGLWPVDFDLLTRLPGLERIDVVATEGELDAGLHERLHECLPGMEEVWIPPDEGALGPRLLVPSTDEDVFVLRDREDELERLARRVRGVAGTSELPALDGLAVVFRRPLPYLYLAPEVFSSASIPVQTYAALPLASEPYAAVFDLLCSVASSGFTRTALIGLLESPHLTFVEGGEPLTRTEIASLNRDLAESGYLGNAAFLMELPTSSAVGSRSRRAASVAAQIAAELTPLTEPAPASRHLSTLIAFLDHHHRAPLAIDSQRERVVRGRAAILGGLEALRSAYARYYDSTTTIDEIAATVRRWIETETLAPDRAAIGVQFVDAAAARYGSFREAHLVGLVQDEWPDRPPRNIFYSPYLLKKLGWPAETDWLKGARAAFIDLARLPTTTVSVSTFTLESDAIVEPSGFVEEVSHLGLQRVVQTLPGKSRIFLREALAEQPFALDVLVDEAREWGQLRLGRTAQAAEQFHGQAKPVASSRHTVTAIETYVRCPFRYFASNVLRLPEEVDDEPVMNPRERGRFLHDLLQRFYTTWESRGGGTITGARLDEARGLFREVAESKLAELSESEAAVERTRLMGSLAGPGLIEVVLRIEAEREGEVVERLLEFQIDGDHLVAVGDRVKRVAVGGTADRIDLLSNGTFRLFDYKTGRAPDRASSLQLPIYALRTADRLRGHRDREWTIGEAAYIAFKGERVQSMVPNRGELTEVLEDAQVRFLNAVEGIERGEFPVDPVDLFRCSFCAYSAVCRKDYVGDD